MLTTARQAYAMSELSIDPRAPGAALDQWHGFNTRGLQLAADGEWSAAAEAFASSVLAVSEDQQGVQGAGNDDETPHLLALLLSNLAQARFRAGDRDEGIARAAEAVALRRELAGGDAITVARAQADLAVMVSSVGRLEDARALLLQARTIIEQVGGDEDVRLTSVLENAARVELASGNASGAEPLLLRLHALQHAHGLTTDVADALLQRVARVRHVMSLPAQQTAPAIADVADLGQVLAPVQEAPSALEVITDLAAEHAAETAAPHLAVAEHATSAFVELELLDPPVAEAATIEASAGGATALDVILDLVEPDDEVDDDILGGVRFDLIEPPTPVAIELRDADVEPAPASYDVLGFAVEYGTPTEPTVPDLGEMLMAPPPAKRIPTPAGVATIGLHANTAPVGLPGVVKPATKTAPSLGAIGSATVSATAATREALSSDDRTFGHARDTSNERVGKLRAGRATVPRSSGGLAAASAATAAAAAFIGKLIWSGH